MSKKLRDVIEYLIHIGSVVFLVAGYLANTNPATLSKIGVPVALVNIAIGAARALENFQGTAGKVAQQVTSVAADPTFKPAVAKVLTDLGISPDKVASFQNAVANLATGANAGLADLRADIANLRASMGNLALTVSAMNAPPPPPSTSAAPVIVGSPVPAQ